MSSNKDSPSEQGKKVAKGKCYPCNQTKHWLRNCPKYLAKKKVENEKQSKYNLLGC